MGTDVFSLIAAYEASPLVEYAEPNYIYRAIGDAKSDLSQTSLVAAGSIMPNDDLFDQQWGLNNNGDWGNKEDADIDAPQAWKITKGSSKIVVAVLDSGVDYKHPDLDKKRILTNIDKDYINKDNDAMDDHGHGTYVAGIIAARTNNNEGIAGVCWNCKILPIKVLDKQGAGSTESIAKGIQYAGSKKARIINMSLGMAPNCGCSKTLAKSINYAYEKGSLLIAASGNDGVKDGISYPASSPRVLAVGATDAKDVEADFSNRNKKLNIVAPGVEIYGLDLRKKDPQYQSANGTSAASPFVAGTAGLILSKKPKMKNGQVWLTLTKNTDKTVKGVKNGRLNAYKALKKPSKKNYQAPKDKCSGEPTCTPGCGAEVSLIGEQHYLDNIQFLRALRDEVLRSHVVGKEIVRVYEQHRLEVALILVTDEAFRQEVRNTLLLWMPALQAVYGSSNASVVITDEHIAATHALLDGFAERGSPALQADVAQVRSLLDAAILLEGADITTLWDSAQEQ